MNSAIRKKMNFRIIETPGNKTGSIPAHWDILSPGTDESVCTVWSERAMADMFIKFLESSVAETKSSNPPGDAL